MTGRTKAWPPAGHVLVSVVSRFTEYFKLAPRVFHGDQRAILAAQAGPR